MIPFHHPPSAWTDPHAGARRSACPAAESITAEQAGLWKPPPPRWTLVVVDRFRIQADLLRAGAIQWGADAATRVAAVVPRLADILAAPPWIRIVWNTGDGRAGSVASSANAAGRITADLVRLAEGGSTAHSLAQLVRALRLLRHAQATAIGAAGCPLDAEHGRAGIAWFAILDTDATAVRATMLWVTGVTGVINAGVPMRARLASQTTAALCFRTAMLIVRAIMAVVRIGSGACFPALVDAVTLPPFALLAALRGALVIGQDENCQDGSAQYANAPSVERGGRESLETIKQAHWRMDLSPRLILCGRYIRCNNHLVIRAPNILTISSHDAPCMSR